MEDDGIVDASFIEVTFSASGFEDELRIFVRRAEGSDLVSRGKGEVGHRDCGRGNDGVAEKLAACILHDLLSAVSTAMPYVGRLMEVRSLFVKTSCIRAGLPTCTNAAMRESG